MTNEDAVLTVDEAAAFVGVERSTLYRWARAGRVTFYRVGVRRTVLKRSELEALKKELQTPVPLAPDELGKPRNALSGKAKRRRSK
jgi:excisionase family DNA binding protein